MPPLVITKLQEGDGASRRLQRLCLEGTADSGQAVNKAVRAQRAIDRLALSAARKEVRIGLHAACARKREVADSTCCSIDPAPAQERIKRPLGSRAERIDPPLWAE